MRGYTFSASINIANSTHLEAQSPVSILARCIPHLPYLHQERQLPSNIDKSLRVLPFIARCGLSVYGFSTD